MQPSPVVALNRAIAVAMVDGAERGLELLAPLEDALSQYMPYHAARAGRREDAVAAYRQALELTQNAVEQAFFQRRLRELDDDQLAP
jgi:RNA polymerase sigma-70 factor (ECF subfamily)